MKRFSLGLVIVGLSLSASGLLEARKARRISDDQPVDSTPIVGNQTVRRFSPDVRIQPLTSQIVAVSWKTDTPSFASLEYKTTPFGTQNKEGSFFPSLPLSLNAPYTRLLSARHDLCPTGLKPDTLYYARAWNKDPQGTERVSQALTFRTPLKPADGYTFSTAWYGLQLAEEWRSLNEAEKQGALNSAHIRTIEVLQQWDEIQPTSEVFRWRLGNGRGLDEQVDEIKKWAGSQLGTGKFISLKVRAGGGIGGKRMPQWAQEGVESVTTDGEDEKVVRWDPQYTCCYWQLIKAAGDRYDQEPAVTIVANQATSKTGEMTMSKKFLDALRQLGYHDSQIATNMQWLFRNSLQVYAEAFPQKRLKLNMGRIPVMDGPHEVTYSILDELARTYGKRLSFGTTGFGGERAELLGRYRDQVVVGGFSEKPAPDSPDPVGELNTQFETLIWPHGPPNGPGLGWVILHADALGIDPRRWSHVQALHAFLRAVEEQFAQLRKNP